MKYRLTYIDPLGKIQGEFLNLDEETLLLNLFGGLEDYPGCLMIIKEYQNG